MKYIYDNFLYCIDIKIFAYKRDFPEQLFIIM